MRKGIDQHKETPISEKRPLEGNCPARTATAQRVSQFFCCSVTDRTSVTVPTLRYCRALFPLHGLACPGPESARQARVQTLLAGM